MPTKKGFPTVAEKVAEQLTASFDNKLEKIQSDVADKFARLEQAMLRMAVPQHHGTSENNSLPTPTSPQPGVSNAQPSQPSLIDHQNTQRGNISSDNGLLNANQTDSDRATSDAINDARGRQLQPPTRRRSKSADVCRDTLPRPVLHDPVQDVNKANPWGAWLQKNAHAGNQDLPAPRLVDPDNYDEDATTQHVRNILASTAHHLSSGNAKPGLYPHKFVFRGPEKRRIPLNNVSLAEHLWGLLCIVKDPKTDPRIKPSLLAHLEDVIEDACDFQWPAVRRWSEETFSLIAENRLPNGWYSTTRIQLLRVSMSRIDNAKFNFDLDPQPQRKQQQPQAHNDALKGGPPCQAFNSQAGCTLQSGHLVGGRRMLHICSYCLFQCSTGYQHSEAHCRNKAKFSNAHF